MSCATAAWAEEASEAKSEQPAPEATEVVEPKADAAEENASGRLGFSFDPGYREKAEAEDKAKLEAKRLGAIGTTEGILLLPKLQVEEDRVRIPEHELLTRYGRRELAKQRYLNPGYQKTLGRLAAVAALLANPLGGWNPNNAEASVLYEQDEDLRRRMEMDDLESLQRLPRRTSEE